MCLLNRKIFNALRKKNYSSIHKLYLSTVIFIVRVTLRKIQAVLPLAHRAKEMFLLCVGTHLHQAAAETAGIHPQGPFKIKDSAALAVEALQGAGTSRTATLMAHA